MSWVDSILAPFMKLGVHAYNLTHRPHLDGNLTLNGLNREVEIIRDHWGVPHIYAHSIEDVIFGQGFTHAQERLWQMDLYRRVVAGRVSEVMGKAGLETDLTMRTLGLRQWAEKAAGQEGGLERSITEAYSLGVNECIRSEPLPLEFSLLGYKPEPWTPTDSLSWNYLMFVYLGSSWESELLRGQLIHKLGSQKIAELELASEEAWPLILDANLPLLASKRQAFSLGSPADGVGSNNWVISGSKSLSGSPLLANDMHLQLTAPGIFIQNHLSCSILNVVGVSFPGVPLVIQGHNGRVAWGFTDGFADVQDLFEEHIRTRDGVKEAEYQGQWFPLTLRQEEINIKGKPAITEIVEETRHGPVINKALIKQSETELPAMAMSWTAFDAHSFLESIFRMNKAESCFEFRDALRNWRAVNQNVVYADTLGNIAYNYVGDIPIRAKGNGAVPVAGWTGEYEWTGFIPFEGLPQLFNPSRGYIVTANNRVASSDYPYHLGNDYVVHDRAQRITELIEETGQADASCLCGMQYDQVSPSARIFARVAGGLTSAMYEDTAAITLMREWDGHLAPDSPCAALYEVWIRQTLALMLDEKMAGMGQQVRGSRGSGMWGMHAWEWLTARLDDPDSAWWQLKNCCGRDAVLLEALHRSLSHLHANLGPELSKWRWGNLHHLTFSHIMGRQRPLDRVFNLGPYSIGGDGSTVWASASSFVDLSRNDVVGPPFRFVIDMADPAHARVNFVPGQSGLPGTRHYADGVDDWFNARYHTLLFLRDEITRDAESVLMLKPKSPG